MLRQQRHSPRLYLQPQIASHQPDDFRLVPIISLDKIGQHPIRRLLVGIKMFRKTKLNRQSPHILSPGRRLTAQPTLWRVQRDHPAIQLDKSIEEKSAGIAINRGECWHAKLMNDGAN